MLKVKVYNKDRRIYTLAKKVFGYDPDLCTDCGEWLTRERTIFHNKPYCPSCLIKLLKNIYKPFCKICGTRVDENWVKRGSYNLCLICYRQWQKERSKTRYRLRPETRKINNKNSYCKQNGIEGRYTITEWKAKLIEYDYRCAYCGNILLDNITADHVIPITRGGTGYISNIVPACKHCNSSKNTKTAEEYKEYLEKVNGR